MSDQCTFRCKHCHQQFSREAVYQEASVVLCPHCSKTFVPNFWFYLRKEWIEPLSVAIVLALFIKRLFFEIYVIPTSSMEPTLHGGGHYPEDGGDKVLVNKFTYLFTEPQNWDVVVFQPPHENHLFIKRLIGLPGQKIQIVNGDIYVDNKIKRKPYSVEQAMLYPVYDSRHKESHLSHFSEFQVKPWDVGSGWEVTDNLFKSNKGSGELKFNYPIDMRIESHKPNQKQKDKGWYSLTTRVRPWNEHTGSSYLPFKVGDIQVRGSIKVSEFQGSLQFRLTENETVSKLELDFLNKKARFYLNEAVVKEFDLSIELNQWCSVQFNNVDDKLAARIHDQEFVYEYENENPEMNTYKSGLVIGADACAVEMKDIVISRDVYYQYALPDISYTASDFGVKEKIEGSQSNHKFATYYCQEDQILCFGDNVLDSSDSRMWGFAKKSEIKGQACCVVMPIRLWPGDDYPPNIPFITNRTRIFRIH